MNNENLPKGDRLVDSDITGLAIDLKKKKISNFFEKLKAPEKMTLDEIVPKQQYGKNENTKLKKYYDNLLKNEDDFLQKEFHEITSSKLTRATWLPSKDVKTQSNITKTDRGELLSQVNKLYASQVKKKEDQKKLERTKAISLQRLNNVKGNSRYASYEELSQLRSFVNEVRTERLSEQDLNVMVKEFSLKKNKGSSVEINPTNTHSQRDPTHLYNNNNSKNNSYMAFSNINRDLDHFKSVNYERYPEKAPKGKTEVLNFPLINLGSDIRISLQNQQYSERKQNKKTRAINWFRISPSKEENQNLDSKVSSKPFKNLSLKQVFSY